MKMIIVYLGIWILEIIEFRKMAIVTVLALALFPVILAMKVAYFLLELIEIYQNWEL